MFHALFTRGNVERFMTWLIPHHSNPVLSNADVTLLSSLRVLCSKSRGMGLLLGKISVETPKYEVVTTGDGYEVREYNPRLVAEVTYDPSQMKRGRDGGFMILADYIGAVGKANNQKAYGGEAEKIAMTAPVLTQDAGKSSEGEKIAMTAPVLTKEQEGAGGAKGVTMQFVLPSHYTMENVPRPNDSRVSVKPVSQNKYGVLKFSGVADDNLAKQKAEQLRKALQEAGYKITGDYVLARYNPPWTPGFLRTNEVMFPVE